MYQLMYRNWQAHKMPSEQMIGGTYLPIKINLAKNLTWKPY